MPRGSEKGLPARPTAGLPPSRHQGLAQPLLRDSEERVSSGLGSHLKAQAREPPAPHPLPAPCPQPRPPVSSCLAWSTRPFLPQRRAGPLGGPGFGVPGPCPLRKWPRLVVNGPRGGCQLGPCLGLWGEQQTAPQTFRGVPGMCPIRPAREGPRRPCPVASARHPGEGGGGQIPARPGLRRGSLLIRCGSPLPGAHSAQRKAKLPSQRASSYLPPLTPDPRPRRHAGRLRFLPRRTGESAGGGVRGGGGSAQGPPVAPVSRGSASPGASPDARPPGRSSRLGSCVRGADGRST